jgi:hypothetical protein
MLKCIIVNNEQMISHTKETGRIWFQREDGTHIGSCVVMVRVVLKAESTPEEQAEARHIASDMGATVHAVAMFGDEKRREKATREAGEGTTT